MNELISQLTREVAALRAEVERLKAQETGNLLRSGGTMGGPLLLPDGTLAAPSLAFSADTNTGIYRVGSDAVVLVSGGAAALRADATGIGIGTAASYPLHLVRSYGPLAAAQTAILSYYSASASGNAAGNSSLRALYMIASVSGGNAMTEATGIVAESNSGRSSGTLTVQAGVSVNMRITSTGATATMQGYSVIALLSAAGGVTNYRGFNARSPSVTSTGTITNCYAVYIEDQKVTGVTNGYGVYAAGASDINYFAGKVGVGNNNPGGQLEAASAAAGTVALVAKTAASATADAIQTQNSAGTVQFAVGPDGKLKTNQAANNTNTPSGATAKQLPVYDAAGTLLGFVPVYGAAW